MCGKKPGQILSALELLTNNGPPLYPSKHKTQNIQPCDDAENCIEKKPVKQPRNFCNTIKMLIILLEEKEIYYMYGTKGNSYL